MSIASGTSVLLQRLALSLRAGLSFRGARDYYEVFGYNRVLTPELMLAKYERQDVTRRVVDSPCDAIWGYPPNISNGGKAGKAWEALKSLDILPALLQADKLCAFGEFSILWLGLPGASSAPVTSAKIEDIKYITAYGSPCVSIDAIEENSNNPRYGLPVSYKVQSDVTSQLKLSTTVHWTRVIHIVDKPLQGKVTSTPRLAPIYNLLDDLLKVSGSSAETYWLAANRGMQVDVDKEMQFQKEDADALSAEIDEYQHQLRRVLRTRGVKVNNLGSDGVDPKNVFDTLIALLAAATGIPQRILMGAEAGQLASAQDRANWAEYVERRRKLFAEPYVLKPLFRHLEYLQVLSKDVAASLEYEWPEAFQQNPLEVGQTMSAKARALINLSRQSQYGTPYVGLKEGREMLGLPPDLPSGDAFPMAKEAAKKTGGNADTGGAGGNDGSGDSGGGSQDPNEASTSTGTADPGTT